MDAKYRITSNLNVFDQLAIVRKLAPAFPLIDIQLQEANKDKDKKALTIMMLSRLSDEASNFVVNKCLSVISVTTEFGTYALMKGETLMYQDIGIEDVLTITAEVIESSLGNFLRTALLEFAAE